MALQFGVHILQQRDEVTLLYLLYNTVRHVRLNESHPENLTPSWQGHSVGRYEGDTLVIDTIGIKVSPLSTVDPFGTPHSKALHVVERYRLIDGEAAAEDQQKHGAIFRPTPPYGRGTIDQTPRKRGCKSSSPWRTQTFSLHPGRGGLPIAASSATGRKPSARKIHSSWVRTLRCPRRTRQISER
jgi:hypothetical protein